MNNLKMVKINNIFLIPVIVILLLLFVSIFSNLAFSQLVSLPTSKQVENNSVIVLPNENGYYKNKYNSKQDSHLILPSEYKIFDFYSDLYFLMNVSNGPFCLLSTVDAR